MQVQIVYGSRLGATAEIAERVSTLLRGHGFDARAESASEAAASATSDAFIIGSGVYGGHWAANALSFVRRNADLLSTRPVWLFSSGPIGATATRHQPVQPSEAHELRALTGARDHRTFAGAFDRGSIPGADLGFVERLVARSMLPQGDYRDWPAIDRWAEGIAAALAGEPLGAR